MAKRKTSKKKKEEEEEPVPEPDPEEAPEVMEEQTETIWVLHLSFAGGSQTHTGRAGKHTYNFGGSACWVPVTDPIDKEFFLKKAERNPKRWRVK